MPAHDPVDLCGRVLRFFATIEANVETTFVLKALHVLQECLLVWDKLLLNGNRG